MNSLYTPQVRHYVTTRPWPKDFKFVVDEWDGYLRFIMFRDNFITLDREDQWHVVALVKEMLTKINADGIPMSFARMEKEVRSG